jgi:hypothetical protein
MSGKALQSCIKAARAAQVVKANGLPNYHAVWLAKPNWPGTKDEGRMAGHVFYSVPGLDSLRYADSPMKRDYASVTTETTQ